MLAMYFKCFSQSINHIKNYSSEGEEMAKSVKCVPHKPEDLSLTPSNHVKKPSVMVHICDPSTGEPETGGSLGLVGQPTYPKR